MVYMQKESPVEPEESSTPSLRKYASGSSWRLLQVFSTTSRTVISLCKGITVLWLLSKLIRKKFPMLFQSEWLDDNEALSTCIVPSSSRMSSWMLSKLLCLQTVKYICIHANSPGLSGSLLDTAPISGSPVRVTISPG